jgi:hypothetical protein
MVELIALEASDTGGAEATQPMAFGGFAALCSTVPSANVLARLLLRSLELCSAYAFVLSSPGYRMEWSIRTLLRRQYQDQLEVVRLLAVRMRALGGVDSILRAQLEEEALAFEPLIGRPGQSDALTDIAVAHRHLAAHARLFEGELAALGDLEMAALIHRHVVRRNRRAGWLLSVRLAKTETIPFLDGLDPRGTSEGQEANRRCDALTL